ncbi:MAG: RNA polymerase sigma factor, partial [Brevinematales bacterium]
MWENMSDEDIMKTIQKLQKANPTDERMRGYFEELYRRYYQRGYNLGRFYGLDRYEAEDIVQDSFLKLLLHAHQFRSDENFQVWFMRIVFNTIRDKYREKKRHLYQDIDEMSETLEGKKQNFLETFHFQDEIERIINKIP